MKLFKVKEKLEKKQIKKRKIIITRRTWRKVRCYKTDNI